MPGRTYLATPFDAASTASEVLTGVDLAGRRAVVTGATSGIGVETARALAAAGAQVTLAVRDTRAGARTATDISASTGNTAVEVRELDLGDRASIATFVASWTGPLDILVNNAGVMATPETRTPEGWELQCAINHLAHFALATGLHQALAAAGGARVVAVASAGHQRSAVVFDDIHFERRADDPFLAYGQSKTANILFAVESAKRWAPDGIVVNAIMPGAVVTPGAAAVADGLSADQIAKMRAAAGDAGGEPFWKTPAQGAANSVLLAASPLLDGVTGRYFEDGQEARPHQPGSRTGVAAYALDPDAAAHLWGVFERTIG